MSSASGELLEKVVDLINKAKVEAKEQKTYLLAQVQQQSYEMRWCCSRRVVASFFKLKSWK